MEQINMDYVAYQDHYHDVAGFYWSVLQDCVRMSESNIFQPQITKLFLP